MHNSKFEKKSLGSPNIQNCPLSELKFLSICRRVRKGIKLRPIRAKFLLRRHKGKDLLGRKGKQYVIGYHNGQRIKWLTEKKLSSKQNVGDLALLNVGSTVAHGRIEKFELDGVFADHVAPHRALPFEAVDALRTIEAHDGRVGDVGIDLRPRHYS